MNQQVLTRSTGEILGDSTAREVLLEIFADLHPGLIDESRSITSIFSPQSAKEFLGQLSDISALFSADDTFAQTMEKLQTQINWRMSLRAIRMKAITLSSASSASIK